VQSTIKNKTRPITEVFAKSVYLTDYIPEFPDGKGPGIK